MGLLTLSNLKSFHVKRYKYKMTDKLRTKINLRRVWVFLLIYFIFLLFLLPSDIMFISVVVINLLVAITYLLNHSLHFLDRIYCGMCLRKRLMQRWCSNMLFLARTMVKKSYRVWINSKFSNRLMNNLILFVALMWYRSGVGHI